MTRARAVIQSAIVASAIVASVRGPSADTQLGPGSPLPVPVDQRGPSVGERVPLFELVDQFGRRQSIQTLAGPKGLVLLFVRSADW